MITVSKIVCFVACGFVLGVNLSDQTTWARDEIKVFHPVPRIGGQAGRPYDHMKPEYESSLHAQARIGGQAGESNGLIRLE